ncbi:hypothetical protein BH10PAT3_BH10PAT3_6570 [soil metagenome]
MDGNNPLTADDKMSDEERLEFEHKLREQGINPRELSPDEAKDLIDDRRGDKIGHDEHDDGEDMSGVVNAEEVDGND